MKETIVWSVLFVLGLVMVLFRMDISRYLSDITGLLVTGSILSVFEYSDAPEPGVRRVRATIPVGQSQCFGLAIGVVARLLDIFTTNLGEIFSQMAVWILMGTLISIHSRTAKQAMVNVLAFCLGMLLTYYFVAALSHGIYSREFIIGWTVFALCSPVMAYFAWLTKKQGIFPKIVSVGIIAVSILSSIALFDRPRIYDLLIDGILVYFLFFKKINR